MNQEPCGESITTSPDDSCSGEKRNTGPATPSWTAVPSSAFLVRKPIPRKPIIAAKFGNFPASAMRIVSTDLHSNKAYSTEDGSGLVLGLRSNARGPPKIEREERLEAGNDCLVARPPSCSPAVSQPTANTRASGTGKLAFKWTPTRVEGSASSTKSPSRAIKVFSPKPVDDVSSTPQVQSSDHASGDPMLGKCFVLETDATAVVHQSVISRSPSGDTLRECVSKQMASEEEGGASGEDVEPSEGRGRTLLPMDTDVESALLKTEPKDDELIAEQQLLEEYDPSFLFTMDVEGLLPENQQKQKSRKRKKSHGISDSSSNPVLVPGGGVVKFKKWGHSRLKKVAAREKRMSESKTSYNKSDSTERSKKPLPNAFVSVRIPSAEIRDKLGEIQEAMVAHDKKLQSTLVSLDRLHLTLFVIRLEGEAEVERARVALLEATREVTAELKLLSSPIVLEFGGVGSFSRRVVFASVKEGPAKERLTSAADMVQSIFRTHGICSTDGRPFSPHLTIAKISKSSWRERIYSIDKQVYSEFTDAELGSEVVMGLELLSMVGPAAVDGYYHCLQRYSFEETSAALNVQ